MTSEQINLWGIEGQNLIRCAQIAIAGLDNAGLEILKSAIMLGIGEIYLADSEYYNSGHFLDIPLTPNITRSEQLAGMFSERRNGYENKFHV